MKKSGQFVCASAGICSFSLTFMYGREKWRQKAEFSLHGLEVAARGVSDVLSKRAEQCGGWQRRGFESLKAKYRIAPGDDAGANIAEVAFHAGDLSS